MYSCSLSLSTHLIAHTHRLRHQGILDVTDVNFSSASVDSIAALLQAITPSSQLKLIDRLGVTQVKLIDRLSPPSPSKKRVKELNKTEGMRSATREDEKRVALEEQMEMLNIQGDGDDEDDGEGELEEERSSSHQEASIPRLLLLF